MLIGGAVGALIVAALESWLTSTLPEAWLYVLGAMFILVTIFLPRGVLGLLDTLAERRAKPAAPAPAAAQLAE